MQLVLFNFQCPAVHASGSYTVTVPPKDEECFFVSYPKGSSSTLYGDYDLMDINDETGDVVSPKPLMVVVMDIETERILYRSRRYKKEGTIRVKLTDGQKVQLCIQNGIEDGGRTPSDDYSRTVGFTFMFEPANDVLEMHTMNSRLIKETRDVYRELRSLENHHEYMRSREGIHRQVIEKTFSTLLFWTLLEALTLVGVMVGQIMYIKRFLEMRRYI